MAKTYDTAELRRIASAIRNTSDDVEQTTKGTIQWIRDDIPEHLSGETADALTGTTEDLLRELASCSKELDEIGSSLRHYAYLLDQADRRTAELINQGR